MDWKRLALLCLSLALLLTGCGKTAQEPEPEPSVDPAPAQTEEQIWDYTDRSVRTFAEGFDAAAVDHLEYTLFGEILVERRTDDTKMIQDIFSAMDRIVVGAQTDEWATDSDESIAFVMKNGDCYAVGFNAHRLELSGKVYLLEGDRELWRLVDELQELAETPEQPAETPEQPAETPEQPAETPEQPDGGAGDWTYTVTTNRDGNIEYVFNGVLVVDLPADWEGKYTVDANEDGVAFYHTASYELWEENYGFGGGVLFWLGSSDDDSYTELPSYRYLGWTKDGGSYYMGFATDVQGYMEDDAAMREFMDLMEGMDFVENNAYSMVFSSY